MGLYGLIKDKVLSRFTRARETITSQESMRNMTFSQNNFITTNTFFLDEINVWILGDSTKMLEFYTEANIQQYPLYKL